MDPLSLADAIPAPTDTSWGGLVNYGVAGAMLVWFIWRDNREAKDKRKFTQALEGITQALMVSVLNTKSLDTGIADLARTVKGASESRVNETSDS